MSISFVLGGARSGKSRFSQELALSKSRQPVYLATSRLWDDDHRARIARHQAERGPEWENVEAEKEISHLAFRGRCILLDCITLWLTNFFVDEGEDLERSLSLARAEFERAVTPDNDWIIVSNELGQSLHAPTESGRKFVDLQGFFNQFIAAQADHVVLMVAGLPLTIAGPQTGPREPLS